MREIEFEVKCVPMNKYVFLCFLRNVNFLNLCLRPVILLFYSGFLEIVIKFQGRDMQSFRDESPLYVLKKNAIFSLLRLIVDQFSYNANLLSFLLGLFVSFDDKISMYFSFIHGYFCLKFFMPFSVISLGENFL